MLRSYVPRNPFRCISSRSFDARNAPASGTNESFRKGRPYGSHAPNAASNKWLDASIRRRDRPGQAAIPRTGRSGGFLNAACGARETLRRAEPAASGRKVASVAARKPPASPCDGLVGPWFAKTQHYRKNGRTSSNVTIPRRSRSSTEGKADRRFSSTIRASLSSKGASERKRL